MFPFRKHTLAGTNKTKQNQTCTNNRKML